MAERMEAIREWQQRLESVFVGATGIVGERVLGFSRAEQLHRSAIIANVRGFNVLMDSLMDFAIMTIEEASCHGHTMNVFDFALNIVAVQRLRAALTLFYDGYYFDAATHIRSVYEISLYLGAVLHGHFWFDELFSPKKHIDYEAMPSTTILKIHRQHRAGVAKVVRRKMRGEESGLSAQERDAVEEMFSILNHHVHYGLSTVYEYMKDMRDKKTLPSVFPVLDMRRASIFCNSIVCASWTLLRALPWLSLPRRYSEDWRQRYRVLDDSFDAYLRAWDKPVGPAFLNLMRLQFTFDPVKAAEQVEKTGSLPTI